MSVLTSGFGSSEQAQYQISRSLRFNSADSAYLNRTPASAGNRKTWTFSCWLKLASLTQGERNILFGPAGGEYGGVTIYQNAGLRFAHAWDPSGTDYVRETVALFRDPSAWYHVVWWCDTTQSGTRWKIYVNGILQTLQTPANNNGEPAQNTDLAINSANVHYLGGNLVYGYFSGLMTEVNFIDGQALTPSSFGEFDNTTGVWKPKKYTGTYGTNGFYLNFSDNSATTATTLGKDSSGNNNNWTPNNFSVTAGAGNDSMVDTPTPYGTDTGIGGQVRGNYCTLTPLLFRYTVGVGTITNGNLQATGSSTYFYSTFQMPATGKWYFEGVPTAGSSTPGIGLSDLETARTVFTSMVSYLDNGNKNVNGIETSYGASYTTNDVIGVAVDCDAGTITFYKNNASQGAITTTVRNQFVFLQTGLSWTWTMNFGQRPFAYTAPSGFKALCTTNLPEPTIKKSADHFNTVLYTGTGSTRSVTGVGFTPGLTWIKSRSAATDHALYDTVRGTTKQLESNNTAAETTESTGLTSFDSNGFTVGSLAQLNTSTASYVGWNWKGGGTAVTNTQGTITSQVSANPSAGFSIVTFTTPTSGDFTVGHGLGVAPKMYIVKRRGNDSGWGVWHTALTGGTWYLTLESTAAQANNATIFSAAPTSTLLNIGSAWTATGAQPSVAYCFAEIAGYSAFGSYTGNGSADGPFVYLGFRPRFILLKVTNTTGNWTILDTAREGYNVDNDPLYPNLLNAEGTTDLLDILSNGFKLRTTDASVNGNTYTYIYAAFAENPFKYALAR